MFEEIAYMPDGPARQQKINQWLAIVRQDNPWIWGFYPIGFRLYQPWLQASKPNAMAYNTLKYLRLNGPLRAKLRAKWNPPVTWPLWILLAIILILILPLTISYWLRERRPSTRRF